MNESFGSGPPYESKTHPTAFFGKIEESKIPFLSPNHRTYVKSAVIGSNVSNQCAGQGIHIGSMRAAVCFHTVNFLHRLRNELRNMEADERLSPRYRRTYLLACLVRCLH
jgi:hypothetical protein